MKDFDCTIEYNKSKGNNVVDASSKKYTRILKASEYDGDESNSLALLATRCKLWDLYQNFL